MHWVKCADSASHVGPLHNAFPSMGPSLSIFLFYISNAEDGLYFKPTFVSSLNPACIANVNVPTVLRIRLIHAICHANLQSTSKSLCINILSLYLSDIHRRKFETILPVCQINWLGHPQIRFLDVGIARNFSGIPIIVHAPFTVHFTYKQFAVSNSQNTNNPNRHYHAGACMQRQHPLQNRASR